MVQLGEFFQFDIPTRLNHSLTPGKNKKAIHVSLLRDDTKNRRGAASPWDISAPALFFLQPPDSQLFEGFACELCPLSVDKCALELVPGPINMGRFVFSGAKLPYFFYFLSFFQAVVENIEN